MQVILTPTAVPDLFGPGLNGFKGDTPPLPPATQVSPEWLNSVQQELVNAILDQGYALDSLNLGQLTIALNGWKFSGSPEIMSGATLFVRSGGFIQVESGGQITLDASSTFEGSGDFSILASGSFLVGPNADFSNDIDVEGAANLNGNVTIGDNATDALVVNSRMASDLDVNTNSLNNVSRLALSVGVVPLNAGQLTAGSLGVLRYQPQGTAHYVHTTENGYVRAVGATTTGSTGIGGTVSNISSCTISPNTTGNVTVTVKGYLDFSTLGTSARILIRDDTLVATINGGGGGLVEYPITIGGSPVGHSFTFEVRYALPSAVTRTFSARITANIGNVTYTDVTVTVSGVQ